MNRADMDATLENHFMYEATDNVEGVLSTLTADVHHDVTGSPWGPLVGREAVRPFYEQLFHDLKGEGVEPVARWYGDSFIVDETVWTGHIADARVFGLEGRSGHVSFGLLHVLEFRDGKISRERVWSDVAAIAAQTQA